MKKIFLCNLSLLLIVSSNSSHAELSSNISIDTRDIPLTRCLNTVGGASVALDLIFDKLSYDWSEYSWGDTRENIDSWSPDIAGMHITSSLDGFYRIVVRFQLSDSDIDFFEKLRFYNTTTRVPMALEVDIVDYNYLFGDDENDFRIVDNNLPAEAFLKEDVSALDSRHQLSAIIMEPWKLAPNNLYEIVFEPNGNVRSGRVGELSMVWQISANYKWIAAMNAGVSSKCDLLDTASYLIGSVGLGYFDEGFRLVKDNYEDDIPKDALDGWYYFNVASDPTKTYEFWTRVGKYEDITCWDDEYEKEKEHNKVIGTIPGAHNEDGPEYCQGYGGQNLFLAPLGTYYHYNADIAINGDSYIGNYSNGSGGTFTPPTDPPASGKLPDFITSKVTMGNKSGNKEKYTWKINETAYVHDYIDNIGTADWEGKAKKIKVPFYLSKGTKEDSHSEWVRIGERQEIKKEHLKVNSDPKHEKITFKLQDYANDGTIMPGRTYNFVVCADRPKDQDNGDGDVQEKSETNNCSTEAVFYVDYGPARNVDLLARNLALTGGRSSLQAGEKYGLQVEISNIGTEQPWNGFSSSYEIKGPGTGGAWQRIGEDTSRASSLYPNATHFESMSSEQEAAAPMTGGDYVFRACTDSTQAVPETDESNNCTAELPVYIAPPPMPDLITEGLQLTHGRTSLIAGELYGLTVAIRNIGDAKPSSDIRTNYEIKGPGTGDAWQFVADDGTDADNLVPGAAQWEEITDGHGAHIPAVPGTYTARACADYQGNAAESDETNNCSEISFEVLPVPPGSPRIVITNPTHTDEWRSDSTAHDIRWERYDFPSPGHVKIEYSLDGGATWLLIDDNTTNDEVKHWDDMCDFHTVDTDDAMIRITSLEYPYVYDVSDEFTIDHAKECK